mgnify:CR=1 FL=1
MRLRKYKVLATHPVNPFWQLSGTVVKLETKLMSKTIRAVAAIEFTLLMFNSIG